MCCAEYYFTGHFIVHKVYFEYLKSYVSFMGYGPSEVFH